MKKIRWGVIGTGRIAEAFCNDMVHVHNAELKAVASRTEARAALFARQHHIDCAYGSYDALINNPDIDAVYIATPHSSHFENIKKALSADKAVLCEKPLTTTPDHCSQLIELLSQSKGYLMEAMWTYFLPVIQKAQAWIRLGRIGRVKHVKADFGYPIPYAPDKREYNDPLAGGCLLEMGIYPIAIATLIFNTGPDKIQVNASIAPNGVEDDVVMLCHYPQGKTATLATSFQCKLPNWAYIIGESGYIAIPDFWRASECYLYQLDEQVDHYCDNRKSIGLNFQTASVVQDIVNHKQQSAYVSLNTSLLFQEQIAAVKKQLPDHELTNIEQRLQSHV